MPMPAETPASAPLKDLFEFGEALPLGHMPAKIYALPTLMVRIWAWTQRLNLAQVQHEPGPTHR